MRLADVLADQAEKLKLKHQDKIIYQNKILLKVHGSQGDASQTFAFNQAEKS